MDLISFPFEETLCLASRKIHAHFVTVVLSRKILNTHAYTHTTTQSPTHAHIQIVSILINLKIDYHKHLSHYSPEHCLNKSDIIETAIFHFATIE